MTRQGRVTVFLTAFVLLASCAGPRPRPTPLATVTQSAPTPTATLAPQHLPTPAQAEPARVRRVIDGDTVVLDNGEQVRYIGMNTPERDRPFYEEASAFNRSLVEGREVRLEFDVGRRDQYQRLLAYVWLDDVMVNLELVRQGFANAFTVPPDVRYAALFRDAERAARQSGRGLWARAPIPLRITSLHASEPEWVEITNQGNEPVPMRGYTLKDAANHLYTFPDFTLAPGKQVRLFTGTGQDSADALYWRNPGAVWNNDHDSAFLRDAAGDLVDSYEY